MSSDNVVMQNLQDLKVCDDDILNAITVFLDIIHHSVFI
jgi:hypothetical protein